MNVTKAGGKQATNETALDVAPSSIWFDGGPRREFPSLAEDLEVDVAVVGGGIFGLTTAVLLARSGARVALLEARRIGDGVTGHSTAKVSSLHGLTYGGLASRFDDDVARAYGEANEAGLAMVAGLVGELGIDCDFRRRPNFTYAVGGSDRDKVEKEAEVAQRLGLPASLVDELDLPFDTAGAVRFEDQAEFHPVKYLQGLAADVPSGSGVLLLYESTRVVEVEQGEPCALRTDTSHKVRAPQVVIATHFPILDRGLYFARMSPHRSYALAARISGQLPKGMYLSTQSDSIRTVLHKGDELLIVGGQGHKSGYGDTRERYEALERWTRERFSVERIEHAWAAQDGISADGMPFIGRLWPGSERIWTATGFRKWGIAMGTAAAEMVTDAIQGTDSGRLAAFDPDRLGPPSALKRLIKENAQVGIRFFRDRFRRGSADDLASGEGRVIASGMSQSAVYRDENGDLHRLSARCTHLGCLVSWNAADRSWDCPCHGSRFGIDGEVIEGPAVTPLARRDRAATNG